MAKSPAKSPAKSLAKSDDRQARLAQALRDNLKRRKAGGSKAGESPAAETGGNDADAAVDPRRNPAAKPF